MNACRWAEYSDMLDEMNRHLSMRYSGQPHEMSLQIDATGDVKVNGTPFPKARLSLNYKPNVRGLDFSKNFGGGTHTMLYTLLADFIALLDAPLAQGNSGFDKMLNRLDYSLACAADFPLFWRPGMTKAEKMKQYSMMAQYSYLKLDGYRVDRFGFIRCTN